MTTKSALILALDEAIAALTKARLILDAPDLPANLPQGSTYMPTNREQRLIDLAKEGLGRGDIAADLGVSLPRVGQLVAHLRKHGVDVPTPRVNPLRATMVASAKARVDKLRVQVDLLEAWDDLDDPSEELLTSRAELAQAQDTFSRIMAKYS